jgi:ubiquinone/menaquinone biosynthesis C-methylase UbiE
MDDLQQQNQSWWETNPMVYDWQKTLQVEPDTQEFYQAIDERFFKALRNFAHPRYPDQKPFSEIIDYDRVKGKRVLEIGCGAGGHAMLLAQAGADLTAIDLTQNAIDMTLKRFEVFGLEGDIRQGDAEELEFPDNTFDLVWSWGVIHHSANMQRVIDEIHRVLKPGGLAQIMVYHRNSVRYWIVGGLVEGVLKGKLLRMSLEEVNKSFTDGYIARHLTSRDAGRRFSAFSRVETRVMDQGDEIALPGYRFLSRSLLNRIIPRPAKVGFDVTLQALWGWFLFIEATK